MPFVFPLLALSYLLLAVFNLHTSVLALLTRNLQLMQFYAVHVVLFPASAALLDAPLYGLRVGGGNGPCSLLPVTSFHTPEHRQPGLRPCFALVCGLLYCYHDCFHTSQAQCRGPLLPVVPLVSPRARASLEGYIRISYVSSILTAFFCPEK
jgi:hypothetical protein